MKRLLSIITLSTGIVLSAIPNPTTHTLNNGLKIIMVKNPMAPVVYLGVLYNVGTADDPSSEVGLSHFLEHMMFKGSPKFTGDSYRNNITKIGGGCNAYTSYDLTHYISHFPKEGLPLVLDMEASRMKALSFDVNKDMIPEQNVVHQERLMRMENSPYTEILECYLRACYWYHPYGVPPIGYPHHIGAYTKESVLAHHKKWYIPNNATLIIVGDVDEQKTLELVRRHFGYIKPGTLPDRIRPQEPNHKGVAISLVQKNNRNANIVMFFNYRIPAYRLLPKGHFNALRILDRIFAAQETSPLYKEFVHGRKMAISVGLSSCSTLSIDDTYAMLSATLPPHKNSKMFKKDIFKWLQDFVNNHLSTADIQQARKEIINGKAFIHDEPDAVREAFSALAFGLSVEDIITRDQDLETVTLQDVKDVYNTYLNKTPDVSVMILPQKTKQEQAPPKVNNKPEQSIWASLKEHMGSIFTKQ